MTASSVSLCGDRQRERAQDWLVLIALWLAATVIASFFALIVKDSTIVGDAFIPRGNDSFYHARRILDALGERGFYQFDTRVQAPEGAWIPWPWGYDYLIAKAAEVASWLRPGTDPMHFISYIPVAWIGVNAALFLAAASALGLSLGMRALAMLCFALSPLTQFLHVIAMIDHHYIEYTFVLLTVWLGIRWFDHPESAKRATALGSILGLSVAFHNGLFVLQIVPLTVAAILWLRSSAPARSSLIAFSAALLVATTIVVLPSEPFRNGFFEFGLLSWFHVYIAVSSSAIMLYLGWRPCTAPRLAALAGLGILLALPIAADLLRGASFVTGELSILNEVAEARSPYRLSVESWGFGVTASYYSWLIVGAPFLLVYFAYKAATEHAAGQLCFAVSAVLGLTLLLMQFRFYYFGSFALLVGGLAIVDQLRARHGWHSGAVFVTAFVVLVLAYQPPLRDRLFLVYPLGVDEGYEEGRPIHLDLAELCDEDPGIVLAGSDDGSPILFHSECSVLANNFILRAEDDRKIAEIARLMRLSPAEIRAQAPEIKYLFLRARDFSRLVDGVRELAPENPIARQLFIDAQPPPGFRLIRNVDDPASPQEAPEPFARLYKVVPISSTGR